MIIVASSDGVNVRYDTPPPDDDDENKFRSDEEEDCRLRCELLLLRR